MENIIFQKNESIWNNWVDLVKVIKICIVYSIQQGFIIRSKCNRLARELQWMGKDGRRKDWFVICHNTSSSVKTFQSRMDDRYWYIPISWVVYDPYQSERLVWKQVS